jgi:hypothetical protein
MSALSLLLNLLWRAFGGVWMAAGENASEYEIDTAKSFVFCQLI